MSNAPTEVPDHILDIVVAEAETYITRDEKRWLGGFDDARRAEILRLSTHHLVRDPARRDLHRKILLETASTMTGEPPKGQPILFYVNGPMAVGKSTLLQMFNERMAGEQSGTIQPEFPGYLERTYAFYRAAKGWSMQADFQLFKARLPEFAANGREFAVIRPEASGLASGVAAWAKELKAHTLHEELGDGRKAELVRRFPGMRLIVVSVTADPVVNLARLHRRNDKTGQVISDAELARTIRGSSAPGAFTDVIPHAEFAVMLEREPNFGFQPILVAEDGEEIFRSPRRFDRFLALAAMDDEQLFGTPASELEAPKPPDP